METLKKYLWDTLKIVLTIGTIMGFIFIFIWVALLQWKNAKSGKSENNIVIDPSADVIETSEDDIEQDILMKGIEKGLDVLKNIQGLGN